MRSYQEHRGSWRATVALLLWLPAWAVAADFTDAYNAAARREWDSAAQQFQVLAREGDARAQIYLANMYRQGLGVPRDPAQAVYWTEQAANQGDAKGQYNLGVHYSEGLGVDRDDVRANELFEAAARQGRVEAQINFGLRLLEGTGVEADPVRGLAWLEKAARSGDDAAVRRRDHHAERVSSEQREAAIELSKQL